VLSLRPVSLVVLESVGVSFGRKQLLRGCDLRLDGRDRIGLVGPNGSGKSTLMRLISGEMSPDTGSVRTRKGLRIGVLPQDIPPPDDRSVIQLVLDAAPGRPAVEAELAAAEEAVRVLQPRVDAGEDGAEEEMMDAAQRLAEAHEWQAVFDRDFSPHEAHAILAGLGFAPTDAERRVGELSGGWRMRVHLAALLFRRPDLMLLDEPTNHLDLPSVAWLGDFLRRYPHGFVLICHDREFLDEQIDRVVSFEPEGVRQYRGNYTAYRKQREEEEIVLENKARNIEREREKAEQFIDRFRAQAHKARAVQSRIKQLGKIEDVVLFEKRRVMRFAFPPCDRAGAEAVKIRGLKKAYGEHVVFPGLDLGVARGDKIGIIGINGAGKTTLLRMLAGEIPYDAGTLELGYKITPGYYAQHHAESLNRSLTVLQEVSLRDPEAGQTRVRSILGAFLFSGDDVDKKVAVLSGGERARVALAKLLIKPGNLLLMDEPTNHLDLESSESLAESLSTYDGTLLFVSHNRAFVRRLATKIWNVHDGTVEIYPGTLDEYLASARLRGQALEAVADGKAGPTKQPRSATAGPQQAARAPAPSKRDHSNDRDRKRQEADERARQSKRLKPLQRKVAELEARIAELEDAQKQRSVELADPNVYSDDARRTKLLDDYQDAASKLEELGGRWELATMELEEVTAELGA
jgi:ATP-binding cassette subfamily F protein 3